MTRMIFVVALVAFPAVGATQSQTVVTSLSEWKISTPRDTVKAGSVTFRVTNDGSMNHALYVRGPDVDEGTREIAARQSASLRLTLKPGTYDVFCPMSDESHKMAGMARKLVVIAGDAPPPKKP